MSRFFPDGKVRDNRGDKICREENDVWRSQRNSIKKVSKVGLVEGRGVTYRASECHQRSLESFSSRDGGEEGSLRNDKQQNVMSDPYVCIYLLKINLFI